MDIKDLSQSLFKDSGKDFTERFHPVLNEIQDGDSVLEVGVGWGEFVQNVHRFRKVKLSAVDVAATSLEKVKDFLEESQLADISKEPLKFKDDQFDAVVCLEVFEHLQNPYNALCEIQRVLKPNGKLILSIPNYRGGHVMIYPGLISYANFKQFLRQNYFQVAKTEMWGSILNAGNIGKALESKTSNKTVRTLGLRSCQAMVHLLQWLTRLFGAKPESLYWCYFFICTNKKLDMEKPLWVRQLEQTSELSRGRGWFDPYFHKKA